MFKVTQNHAIQIQIDSGATLSTTVPEITAAVKIYPATMDAVTIDAAAEASAVFIKPPKL